jgi:hypothetical protein
LNPVKLIINEPGITVSFGIVKDNQLFDLNTLSRSKREVPPPLLTHNLSFDKLTSALRLLPLGKERGSKSGYNISGAGLSSITVPSYLTMTVLLISIALLHAGPVLTVK